MAVNPLLFVCGMLVTYCFNSPKFRVFAYRHPWSFAAGLIGFLIFLFGQFRKSRRKTITDFLPRTPVTRSIELQFVAPGGVPVGLFGDENFTVAEDFELSGTREVDFSLLIKEKFDEILPYSIDVARQAVVFVCANQRDIDASRLPFYYQAQRKLATAAYLVPFDNFFKMSGELVSQVDEKPLLSSVLFVQSTGRCGSTLLSKLLHVAGHAYSLSEPDVFSLIVASDELPQPTMVKLIRACTALFAKAVRAYRKNPAESIVIKHRSFVSNSTDLFSLAVPEAKQIFLYRNALDTIDSFAMAFSMSFAIRALRFLHLVHALLIKKPEFQALIKSHCPSLDLARHPEKSTIDRLGLLGYMTLQWVDSMQSALKFRRLFTVCLRYEDLVVQKEKLIAVLLKQCNIASKETATGSLERAFASDAHGEFSSTTSKRLKTAQDHRMFMTPAMEADVSRIIAAHPSLSSTNHLLPDTLSIQ